MSKQNHFCIPQVIGDIGYIAISLYMENYILVF